VIGLTQTHFRVLNLIELRKPIDHLAHRTIAVGSGGLWNVRSCGCALDCSARFCKRIFNGYMAVFGASGNSGLLGEARQVAPKPPKGRGLGGFTFQSHEVSERRPGSYSGLIDVAALDELKQVVEAFFTRIHMHD
jgi:hypothetical protein